MTEQEKEAIIMVNLDRILQKCTNEQDKEKIYKIINKPIAIFTNM